jgi:putative sigma-54 modulation protein
MKRIQEISNLKKLTFKRLIMKVNVHAVNFLLTVKLVGFVQERMILEKYYDKCFFRCLFKS